ncbi:immunoglobulin-like domain-containing protein [Streptococcus infantarius]|uniref:immunoglobulin-like domain-containing protein n=1 Tax=Streptococcus infantarius TaxID=102684 RepID=UPI0022E5C548|nr:immunoglobulin-like domain-containing protein [Streptococcus infantarius]
MNTKVAGTYTLTYTTVDSYGNKATATRKVTVKAVANPTITGVSDTTISQTTAAFDAKKGIVAKDSTGKEISYQVSGEVNTKKVGTYTLTYTAVDDYQNTTTITRNVSVTSANISKPVIEGVKDIEYKRSDHTDKESFKIDQTVTATDYAGRTIPVEASQSEVVNNPGEYKITYSAIDDFDQTTTVVQLVKILDDYPDKVEQGLIPLNGEYFDSNFETYLKDNYSKYISGQFLNALYINDLTINSNWNLPYDTLNFDYFKNLKKIEISPVVEVKNIKISDLNSLSEIEIFGDETTSITMDNLPELKKLTISRGKISTSTNFESMTKITYMHLNNLTGLSKLDLRSLVNLFFVSITNNLDLTTVEFGENTSIFSMDLSNNNINQINLKGLRNLSSLDVSNNNLTELDISNNKSLTEDNVKIGNQAIGFKLIK